MSMTQDERDAVDAMQAARKSLMRAAELAEHAGFGSLVLGPLESARRDLQYALETASGRN